MDKLKQEVLKLNALWQVIGTISARQAFSDAAAGAVTFMRYIDGGPVPYRFEDWMQLEPEEGEDFVGIGYDRVTGETRRVLVPRTVITVKFDKLIVKPPKLNMKNLRQRDNDTCQLTGRKLKPSEMSMEHIVPASKGGQKTWTNIALAHRDVNSERGNRDYKEVGHKAPRAFAPRGKKPGELITPRYPEWSLHLSRN